MLNYIKRYPFSIAIILLVVYLSFFKPPSLDIPLFPGVDKVVHMCMYAGLSGILWLEFLLNHRKAEMNIKHAITGAMICPVAFGGMIELGQQYLTTYRGGDWLDFVANTTGVLIASGIAWYVLRPWIIKRAR